MSKELKELKEWSKDFIKKRKNHEMYPAYCMNAQVSTMEKVLEKIKEIEEGKNK